MCHRVSGRGDDGRNQHVALLVSERIGQFFIGPDRLEYTEYGGGARWVVLLHGQMIPRSMHQRLARAL